MQGRIREEMSVLRERQRRGEIASMMDPKARSRPTRITRAL